MASAYCDIGLDEVGEDGDEEWRELVGGVELVEVRIDVVILDEVAAPWTD